MVGTTTNKNLQKSTSKPYVAYGFKRGMVYAVVNQKTAEIEDEFFDHGAKNAFFKELNIDGSTRYVFLIDKFKKKEINTVSISITMLMLEIKNQNPRWVNVIKGLNKRIVRLFDCDSGAERFKIPGFNSKINIEKVDSNDDVHIDIDGTKKVLRTAFEKKCTPISNSSVAPTSNSFGSLFLAKNIKPISHKAINGGIDGNNESFSNNSVGDILGNNTGAANNAYYAAPAIVFFSIFIAAYAFHNGLFSKIKGWHKSVTKYCGSAFDACVRLYRGDECNVYRRVDNGYTIFSPENIDDSISGEFDEFVNGAENDERNVFPYMNYNSDLHASDGNSGILLGQGERDNMELCQRSPELQIRCIERDKQQEINSTSDKADDSKQSLFVSKKTVSISPKNSKLHLLASDKKDETSNKNSKLNCSESAFYGEERALLASDKKDKTGTANSKLCDIDVKKQDFEVFAEGELAEEKGKLLLNSDDGKLFDEKSQVLEGDDIETVSSVGFLYNVESQDVNNLCRGK